MELEVRLYDKIKEEPISNDELVYEWTYIGLKDIPLHIDLMFYSNVKDKNNVKIFEKDIVLNEQIKGYVIFHNGCFVVFDKNNDYIMLNNLNLKTLSVIGNVYNCEFNNVL